MLSLFWFSSMARIKSPARFRCGHLRNPVAEAAAAIRREQMNPNRVAPPLNERLAHPPRRRKRQKSIHVKQTTVAESSEAVPSVSSSANLNTATPTLTPTLAPASPPTPVSVLVPTRAPILTPTSTPIPTLTLAATLTSPSTPTQELSSALTSVRTSPSIQTTTSVPTPTPTSVPTPEPIVTPSLVPAPSTPTHAQAEMESPCKSSQKGKQQKTMMAQIGIHLPQPGQPHCRLVKHYTQGMFLFRILLRYLCCRYRKSSHPISRISSCRSCHRTAVISPYSMAGKCYFALANGS